MQGFCGAANEELFGHTNNPVTIAERQLFIRCLTEALQDPSVPLGIVIGLRADVSDELLPYPELRALIEKNTVLVKPMTFDQIKDTVKKPAEKMGIELESNMLYALAVDTNGAPGELPLIQQTLLELWRKRDSDQTGKAPKLTMDAYRALGGVKNVMTHRASGVYAALPEEMKPAARRVFLALCELGEGREDHRRRAFRTELINENFPAELIDWTLDRLATERLIVVSQSSMPNNCCAEQGIEMPSAAWQTQQDESSPLSTWFLDNVSSTPQPLLDSPIVVDLVHDSLVHDWDLLRTWLAECRSLMREQRRLEQMAQEWAERKRPKGTEYILGGTQLQEALAFLQAHRAELSELAQEFVITSRKIQTRLRLKTSVLIPLALMAGMAASLVSRFVFPPAPQTPETAEVQTQSNATDNAASTVSDVSTTGNVATDQTSEARGLWQRKSSTPAATDESATEAISAPAPDAASESISESTTATIAANESMAAALENGSYVVVPAGKMPSPSNPEEEVEIWLIQPSGANLPVATDSLGLEFEPTPEPVGASR